jgi:hypothetical protein
MVTSVLWLSSSLIIGTILFPSLSTILFPFTSLSDAKLAINALKSSVQNPTGNSVTLILSSPIFSYSVLTTLD